MNFKKRDEPVYSNDFWYDLTDGGYIDPDEILENDDAKKLKEAIQIVQAFEEEAIANGIIEIM